MRAKGVDWKKLILGSLATAAVQFGTSYAGNPDPTTAGISAGVSIGMFWLGALGIQSPFAAPPLPTKPILPPR